MLNAEKYKHEILSVDGKFGIVGDEIARCSNINCHECKFIMEFCASERIKWLCQEYSPSKKYRALPVEVEAIQFDGNNFDAVYEFTDKTFGSDCYGVRRYRIYTNTGEVPVFNNDYIIKVANGEFYPCKPEVFEKTYEEVEA